VPSPAMPEVTAPRPQRQRATFRRTAPQTEGRQRRAVGGGSRRTRRTSWDEIKASRTLFASGSTAWVAVNLVAIEEYAELKQRHDS